MPDDHQQLEQRPRGGQDSLGESPDAADEPRPVDELARSSYTDAFRVTRSAAADRSAEEWMRDALEHAPWPLRSFIRVGWRTVLGFRSGPRGSPAHVLGWPIGAASARRVVLEQQSQLITARLVLRVSTSEIEWATFVRYEHQAARAVWPIAGLLHRRIVPYALHHAARQHPLPEQRSPPPGPRSHRAISSDTPSAQALPPPPSPTTSLPTHETELSCAATGTEPAPAPCQEALPR